MTNSSLARGESISIMENDNVFILRPSISNELSNITKEKTKPTNKDLKSRAAKPQIINKHKRNISFKRHRARTSLHQERVYTI